MWTKATWKNGKQIITGSWKYAESSECFCIILDTKDRITGENKSFITYNDKPEWGNWKISKEK